MQLFPAVSQRSQRKVYVIGWRPFQVPGVTQRSFAALPRAGA
jgi:hypothetical protein